MGAKRTEWVFSHSIVRFKSDRRFVAIFGQRSANCRLRRGQCETLRRTGHFRGGDEDQQQQQPASSQYLLSSIDNKGIPPIDVTGPSLLSGGRTTAYSLLELATFTAAAQEGDGFTNYDGRSIWWRLRRRRQNGFANL